MRILILTGLQEELLPFLERRAFQFDRARGAYRSLQQANAYPQGPNVSRGSNPVEAFSFNCSSTGPQAFTTGNEVFIITDVIVADGSGSGTATLILNGADWLPFPEASVQSFNSGYPVPPNSTLSCIAYYSKRMAVSGYYAQP